MKLFFRQFEQEAKFGLKRAVYQAAHESGPKPAEHADAGKEAPGAKPELATKEGRQKLYTDVQSKIDQYSKTILKKEMELTGNAYSSFHLEPLASVHLQSSLDGFEPNGSMLYIYVLGAVAVLILLDSYCNKKI